MKGIERITSRIAEDAKKENDTLLDRARMEADSIVSGYKKQAEERVAVIIPKAKAAARENTERRLATAAMEARKLELAAKQRVIAKAFDDAKAALLSLDKNKKMAWLASLAAKASRTGAETVVLNLSDHAELGKSVVDAANNQLGEKGKLALADTGRDFPGGLILSDGDIEVNCTTEALVGAAREELSTEVGKILFG